MRYQRLRVRNYRGIQEVEVCFPEGRLLVIEGPNEAGKSSLVEAVGLLFDYAADSNAEEVRSVRPVGRDVDPEVELEFTAGEMRCRYRKVFGRRGATELEVTGPGRREQLSGREAHDRAKRLRAETTDETLLRALRVLQGGSLDAPSGLDGSAALQRALDSAAADPAGERLFERATAELGRYYTGTRQQETGELRAARGAWDAAKGRVAELEARLRRLEEQADRVAELEPRIAGLQREIEELEATAAILEAERARRREAEQELAVARQELEAARERRQRLADEVQRRASTRRELEEGERRLADSEQRLAALGKELEVAREEQARRSSELEEARAAVEAAERSATDAANDYAHLNDALQVEQMTERLAALDAAQERLKAAEEFLAGCRVSPALLKEIEEAERQLQTTEAQIRSATAQVEVEGPGGAELVVDGTPAPLEGGLLRLEVSEERRIELPGGFVVTVRPSASQGLLERRREERRRALEELLARAGAASVEDARNLEGRRQTAERDRQESERTIRGVLRDLRDRDELAGKLERLRQRVEEYRAAHASRNLPGSIEEARAARDRSGEEREAARRALEAAGHAARDADEQRAAVEREMVRETAAGAAARETVERLQKELAEAEARQASDALNVELADAGGRLTVVKERMEAAEEKLKGLPDVEGAARETETRLAQARGELREAEDALAQAKGVLAHEGEGSLQAELDQARTDEEAKRLEFERAERWAKAAKLLVDTLARHRERARGVYGPRLAERIAELGRKVYGDDFRVELNERLAPVKRSLGGTTLEVNRLSVGAQEQLYVLYLAACAAAAADDGVPFFLDDALGWSDPARLAGMAKMLGDLAGRVQVVVLTCQPGRFAAATGASVVQIGGEPRDGAAAGTDGAGQVPLPLA